MSRICCVCCGRQIVPYLADSDHIIGDPKRSSTSMGCGTWCCYKCSRDLDNHGLFPEEQYAIALDINESDKRYQRDKKMGRNTDTE